MTGFSSFLEMGGYGAFVWPSYLLAAMVLLGLVISSVGRLRANRRALTQLEAQRPPRRSRQAE